MKFKRSLAWLVILTSRSSHTYAVCFSTLPKTKSTVYLFLSFTSFLSSFDVLQHLNLINNFSYFRQLELLSPTSDQYKDIMFNGRGLQAKLRAYDEVIMDNPIICHSCGNDELPIVIDTGAFYSITPDPLYFDDNLISPEFTHLSGISSKTAFNGQGMVTWMIDDRTGV